jgi:hypothetical protein
MIRWLGIPLVLLAASFLSAPSVSAKGRVDQSVIGPPHGFFNLVTGLKQSFRPEATTLTGVKVALVRMGQGPATVTLNVRTGSISGPIIASSSRSLSDYAPGQPSDFEAGVRLEYFQFESRAATIPGQLYVIELVADKSGFGWANIGHDAYAAGNAYWGTQAITAWDFMFQTCGNGDGSACKKKTQYITPSGEIRPRPPRPPKDGDGRCVDFRSDGCDPALTD